MPTPTITHSGYVHNSRTIRVRYLPLTDDLPARYSVRGMINGAPKRNTIVVHDYDRQSPEALAAEAWVRGNWRAICQSVAVCADEPFTGCTLRRLVADDENADYFLFLATFTYDDENPFEDLG